MERGKGDPNIAREMEAGQGEEKGSTLVLNLVTYVLRGWGERGALRLLVYLR